MPESRADDKTFSAGQKGKLNRKERRGGRVKGLDERATRRPEREPSWLAAHHLLNAPHQYRRPLVRLDRCKPGRLALREGPGEAMRVAKGIQPPGAFRRTLRVGHAPPHPEALVSSLERALIFPICGMDRSTRVRDYFELEQPAFLAAIRPEPERRLHKHPRRHQSVPRPRHERSRLLPAQVELTPENRTFPTPFPHFGL